MYKLLPQSDNLTSQVSVSEPTNFFSEAVFAGGNFLDLESAFGRLNGVMRTATGYCGGTLKKPTYREVCEGITGHTEAVKNFGLSTHLKSAIYYGNEEERKQAQESKIRRQMKLNKRIVTKIIQFDSEFCMAENQFQKYYLQKCCRLCESLSLRSTVQFVESNIACKLNG
ncbi:peptide-methionine (S)-S-oxide reductase [Citrus sinensis]|uniref:Peptide-methionine (S)-S-oxide reductase n=1 Tax=Citrus sinensis TaxID=2711 RepID=A0ACB8K310_CITSI|nr:peptide-methionine (S)-S-oxide reductase [Citrus sinensis]